MSGSVSTDSEHTPVRVDSQDSQVSDSENVDNRGWPRQNSVSEIVNLYLRQEKWQELASLSGW